MKIKILIAAVSLVVICAVITIFFFWAGSSSCTPAQWSSIYHYPGESFRTDCTGLIRIMTYNIGYLSGMTNNLPVREDQYFFTRNMAAFQTYLVDHPVDIAVFQEIDFNSHRSYRIDQLETIARESGFPEAARVVNWDKRYVPFPYWPPSVHFGPILSGQGAVSRFVISSQRRVQLHEPDNMLFFKRKFYLQRLAQVLRLKVGGRELVVINVHLEAFDQDTRLKQARQVLELCREFRDNGPLIVLGDFNCVPPDAPQKTGFKDEPGIDYHGDDTVRLFLDETWLASALTGVATFPSQRPDRQLDYIFYTPRWISRRSAFRVPLKSSDHLPIVMEFSLL